LLLSLFQARAVQVPSCQRTRAPPAIPPRSSRPRATTTGTTWDQAHQPAANDRRAGGPS